MQIALIAALLAVIVTRRFSPFYGGLLGVAAALGVGVWGFVVFDEAGTVTFAGIPLSRNTFLMLVAFWLAFEFFGVIRGWRILQAKREEAEEQAKEEQQEAERGGPPDAA